MNEKQNTLLGSLIEVLRRRKGRGRVGRAIPEAAPASQEHVVSRSVEDVEVKVQLCVRFRVHRTGRMS